MNESDEQLGTFKMETQNLLSQLEQCYEAKKRQIEHTFQILFDNVPNEIKNTPLNQTIGLFLDLIKSNVKQSIKDSDLSDDNDNGSENEENEENKVNDENLTHLDVNENLKTKNLTSTVKKLNTIKSHTAKQKLEDIINEQSIIQDQVDSDQLLKSSKPQSKDEQYNVGIYYYLKDGTKVLTKLSDIRGIDIKIVHEKCVEDITTICKLYSKKA